MDKHVSLEQRVLNFYSYFHLHPEISWNEHGTTEYLKNILEGSGCRVETFEDCTGVVAEIGDGYPIVAIRADIDALWQEVDGEFKANHSCGHDAHMAIVLGVMLKFIQKKFVGKIRFIFQPAEEFGQGGLKMIEKGVLEDVEYLFGLHLRPIDELKYGKAAPSIQHGSTSSIVGKIIGPDLHGARPHLGKNAIEVATSLVNMLNTIHLDPAVPYSVKMTRLLAGGINSNIIPGKAEFSLDLRAQTNEVMKSLTDSTVHILEKVKEIYQIDMDYKINTYLPAATVNLTAQDFMQKAIINILGSENLVTSVTTTGGDDFHFYALNSPGLKSTMLALGCDLQPGLHHEKMTFNLEALNKGVLILENCVELALKSIERSEGIDKSKNRY